MAGRIAFDSSLRSSFEGASVDRRRPFRAVLGWNIPKRTRRTRFDTTSLGPRKGRVLRVSVRTNAALLLPECCKVPITRALYLKLRTSRGTRCETTHVRAQTRKPHTMCRRRRTRRVAIEFAGALVPRLIELSARRDSTWVAACQSSRRRASDGQRTPTVCKAMQFTTQRRVPSSGTRVDARNGRRAQSMLCTHFGTVQMIRSSSSSPESSSTRSLWQLEFVRRVHGLEWNPAISS